MSRLYIVTLHNLYAEYIMRNAGLDEAHTGIKIARRNIWDYCYFSLQSWFQLVRHPAQHFVWCTLHISYAGWQYTALTYSFPSLETVCCSMSISNCCVLTCIRISQQAGQVVWYSYLLKNFPQFVVIHTVKGFGIVNKAEVDVFWELSF